MSDLFVEFYFLFQASDVSALAKTAYLLYIKQNNKNINTIFMKDQQYAYYRNTCQKRRTLR